MRWYLFVEEVALIKFPKMTKEGKTYIMGMKEKRNGLFFIRQLVN